jgi:hypothetical protein
VAEKMTESKIRRSRSPHWNAELSGAGGQARTDDLLFTKQLLYQLSYTGAMIL